MNRPESHFPADSTESPAHTIARLEAAAHRIDARFANGRIVFRRFGGGDNGMRPLVLLHGGHGTWKHWIANIAALARTRPVVCADMPGFGDSDAAAPVSSLDAIAAGVLAGLDDALGTGTRFDLAGFSFGSIVGGKVAHYAGARIEHFVVVGAGGLGVPSAPMTAMRSWRHLADEAARVDAHRHNLATMMLVRPARIDALAIEIQQRNTEQSRVKSRPAAHTPVLADALPLVEARVAGIWGAADALAGGRLQARIERIHAVHPQAPVTVIPGAGHWVQYDAPEEFNAALEAHLARGASAG